MEDGDARDIEAWRLALGTLPEVLSPADLPKLNEGLRYLLKELRQAQAEFRGGRQLDGAYLSLCAVYAFLTLFHPMGVEGLAVPLSALENALWKLDEGITEALLKPAQRAKGGRPPASLLRQEFIGMVAYTVEHLCHLGYSLAEAHAEVARDLTRVGVKTDRGSDRITARTVRGWCEQVSENVGRHSVHSPAALRWAVLRSDPRKAAIDRMPPKAAASLLRGRLVDTAQKLGIASPAKKTT